MAQESKTEVAETVDMEVENPKLDDNGELKRPRDEENDAGSKKHKVAEKSVEERRMENAESSPVSLGPKTFLSGVEMVDYFTNFLHGWHTNLDVNKYEHLVLLDLVKKGHPEHDTKIDSDIRAFQVRFNPTMNRKCYFLVKDDEVVDDFNFVKCVDHILPLPEDMKAKLDANREVGGKGGGRGHGRRGRGRGKR